MRLRALPYTFRPAVLTSRGCFTHGLIAFKARSCQELTPPTRFATFPTVKVLLQTCSSGRVPVPPEKRFLINRVGFRLCTALPDSVRQIMHSWRGEMHDRAWKGRTFPSKAGIDVPVTGIWHGECYDSGCTSSVSAGSQAERVGPRDGRADWSEEEGESL